MAKKKQYDDDDNRTVADMSGLSKTPLLIPKPFGEKKEKPQQADEAESKIQLTGGERRSFIFGAVSAALVIGLIFAAAFAAVIVLILLIGK